MNVEQLRKVHRATPFQPFVLHMADGRDVRVPHPEFLWIPPNVGRTVWVATGEEVCEFIDVLLVTSIEIGNDKPRKRPRKKK